MSDFTRRSLSLNMVMLALVSLAACSSLNSASDKVASAVSPYKIDVVQGNVVTREQLAAVKVGMPRALVRDILGTPLLASVFHADRWDYVFTLQRKGSEPQSRRVTLYFKGDVLDRIDADELPSESEFVATLMSKVPAGPLPSLEASGDALSKFPAPVKATPAALPAAATNYPPLESNK